MRLRSPLTVAILATAVAFGSAVQAQRPALAVAAASDLQAVMPELASRFERDTGISVRVSFGSSGNFFAQVQNGAPFDVFFSADIDYPARLVASGHADADTLYEYAAGHLVLWTRGDSGIDIRRGLEVLTDPRVQRIAIANPNFAPYGRAAAAALQHEQLYDRVKAKLVLGENIAQTAQFAQTGNAQVALISLSLALGPSLQSGTRVEIPETFYPPVKQAAVVLTGSKDKTSARLLLSYLRRPAVAQLFRSFGFNVPGAAL